MPIEEITATFAATLLGVVLGIPSAFWIDRKMKQRKLREKAVSVLSGLKEEINHNLSLLKQIQNQLQPNTVIYFNMDVNTWRATSLQEFEGVISHDLLRHIYRIYYEYEHLSRKINVQFSMHYSVVRAMTTYGAERATIVQAILNHAAPLEKESEELVNEINTELTRLSQRFGSNTKSSQKTEIIQDMEKRREHLDNMFGIALVLLGILSAAEFQYFLALYPLQNPPTVPLAYLYYLLRVNTAPFVVLIISWLVKETYSDAFKPTSKMLFTEFCWDFFCFTLFYYLLVLIGGFEIGIALSLFLTFLMILAITWAYGRASPVIEGGSMRDYYTKHKWIALRYGVVFVGSYVLLVALVYSW